MQMSLVHYLLVVCFLQALGLSNGLAFRDKNEHPHLNTYLYPAENEISAETNGQQSSRKHNLLEVFLAKLLQKEILAGAQDTAAAMLDQELAEEEADQLTSITRYVGVGYNLLKGSPDGDFEKGGTDPGILISRVIFDFTYHDGGEAYFLGTTVKVPDQVDFQPAETCAKMNQASVYSGEKSYQDSLSYGISTKGN